MQGFSKYENKNTCSDEIYCWWKGLAGATLKAVEMPKMKGHCDLAIIVFNVNFLGPARNNSGLQLARSLLIHAKHANVLQKLWMHLPVGGETHFLTRGNVTSFSRLMHVAFLRYSERKWTPIGKAFVLFLPTLWGLILFSCERVIQCGFIGLHVQK